MIEILQITDYSNRIKITKSWKMLLQLICNNFGQKCQLNNVGKQAQWHPPPAVGTTAQLPALDAFPGVSGVAPEAKNRTCLGEYRQTKRASKDARFFEASWQWSTSTDVRHSSPSGQVVEQGQMFCLLLWWKDNWAHMVYWRIVKKIRFYVFYHHLKHIETHHGVEERCAGLIRIAVWSPKA